MNALEWDREIVRLQVHFNRKLSIKQAKSWYHYLKKHTARALAEAVDELNVSKRAFPSFGELIDTVTRFERPSYVEPRQTVQTEIHPRQRPAARLLLNLMDCSTESEVSNVCKHACESHPEFSELFLGMARARIETLPRSSREAP